MELVDGPAIENHAYLVQLLSDEEHTNVASSLPPPCNEADLVEAIDEGTSLATIFGETRVPERGDGFTDVQQFVGGLDHELFRILEKSARVVGDQTDGRKRARVPTEDLELLGIVRGHGGVIVDVVH